MKELLLQSLEHERGGLLVYRTALECAVNEQLRTEWEKYFDQTENHVSILTRVCIALGLDPGERTPGCEIVHHMGIGLVVAMKRAMATGDAQAAELVACECVVLAETRDHANWELLCECAKALDGDSGRLLAGACAEVQDEEDEHLYHSRGWSRELWLQALGLSAVIPPPEGKQEVRSVIEAARAKREARGSR
jgi:hypothetical protein